jgi:hypothetical protein
VKVLLVQNLFVYHLPHDLTDADSYSFQSFWKCDRCKVYVDKYTGEKARDKFALHCACQNLYLALSLISVFFPLLLVGFVSYDSVISAEAAIEQMNGFQIGNKRLKVQHKRVHGNAGSRMGPQDPSVSSVSPTPLKLRPPVYPCRELAVSPRAS